MRLWDYRMLGSLPDNQLKGQWRECVLIAHDIKNKGTTNHLLINRIMEYPIDDFLTYCLMVSREMTHRGFRMTNESACRLGQLGTYRYVWQPFAGWHNYKYLRVCMANLYEKHEFGVGKSRIRKHFPELWEELRDMDRRTWFQFKATYTVEDLNTRFILEDEREAQGLPINTKDFYAELKSRLGKTQLEVKE